MTITSCVSTARPAELESACDSASVMVPPFHSQDEKLDPFAATRMGVQQCEEYRNTSIYRAHFKLDCSPKTKLGSSLLNSC